MIVKKCCFDVIFIPILKRSFAQTVSNRGCCFGIVAALSGIGALAYTVNETVKKNKSKDPK